MAHTRKYSRKSQRRRQRRGSKRRGQSGGNLHFSEINGGDQAGAAGNMMKLVGAGPTQTTGQGGSIAINAQTGGKSRRRQQKLRGGSLMDALSSAVVPLALFGINKKVGDRLRKK
jgi:hypothetical protein